MLSDYQHRAAGVNITKGPPLPCKYEAFGWWTLLSVAKGQHIGAMLPAIARCAPVQGEPPESARVIGPSSGAVVVETRVPVNAPYADPGARAFDIEAGDLTARISFYGLKPVLAGTTAPTPAGQPLLIKHDVKDDAGRAAETRIRRVYVECDAERGPLCASSDGSGEAFCSLGAGVCVPAIAPRFGDAVPPPASVVRLLGPPGVELFAGSAYGRCVAGAPLEVLCDPGAVASDGIEGTLTPHIQV